MPIVDVVFVLGGGGGGGGGEPPSDPEPVIVMPTVPSTVPTVSGIALLNVSEPELAASVPTLLACPRLNVPGPNRRSAFAVIADPAFSVTAAACRSTVA